MRVRDILEKTMEGRRLNFNEAVFLLEEADFLELGRAANLVCRQKHPDGVATFLIDRNINYTNICRNECRFCAFYRTAGDPEAYVLGQQEIKDKIAEAIELSGTQVMLQGGVNPDLKIDYYVEMLKEIKRRFDIRIHSFSPPEIVHMAESSGMTISETLEKLKEAGLDSLPGGGAEILVDEVRQRISPRKISSALWLKVMGEAHKIGLTTTATMMMGSVESVEDRVEHLERVRELQDETGGFISFIPWTFQPGNTALGGEPISSFEYLRMLALSRLYLDNFPNIQGSWVTQGKEVGQISLSFGANDLGSIMIEENVVRAAGVSHKMSIEEMVYLIKNAGKIPAQRDTEFNILRVYGNAD
ncbi:MAG TPA: dehypoxanthine futalosine cyclase [Actinobacteria bacterium]|nr:dehypoxanthine futalosine cyclase [Actinomycetota bacterium]